MVTSRFHTIANFIAFLKNLCLTHFFRSTPKENMSVSAPTLESQLTGIESPVSSFSTETSTVIESQTIEHLDAIDEIDDDTTA